MCAWHAPENYKERRKPAQYAERELLNLFKCMTRDETRWPLLLQVISNSQYRQAVIPGVASALNNL